MEIGFPASYSAEIRLRSSRGVAREAVLYTFERLGWIVEQKDPDTFIARTVAKWISCGARFEVSLAEGGVMRVKSRSEYFRLIDFGDNRRNVELFEKLFTPKETRDALIESEIPFPYGNEDNSPIERMFADEDAEQQ